MHGMQAEGRWRFTVVAAVVLALCTSAAASAQVAANPNQGNMTMSGGMDFLNAYMFRGLRQEDAGVVMWPWGDLGIVLSRGTGAVQRVAVNIGTWNSLHTGPTGSGSSSGKLWYEGDLYGTLGLEFDGGVNLAATYTAYTSPNNAFTTVKEIAFKATLADVGPAGFGLSPYALVALEMDTSPGVGQADGGLQAGRYLEVGIAPQFEVTPVTIALPIKTGFSLDDYYELTGVDHRFGFLSLGGVVTVPLAVPRSYGTWNVHGGVEFQSLGDTPEAFNGGDQSKVIGSIGLGFSY
jgi:hypothetical protein